MIPSILDRFNIEGPNGKHICLVTGLAKMSFLNAKTESWVSIFQLEVARALAAQLVIGIRYMHSQGFFHGDHHCGNILLQPSREFDQLSTEALYELYGEPLLEPVNRIDGQSIPPGVPEHGISPIWLGKASEDVTLQESRLLLSDLGETFRPVQQKKFESRTPLVIRPPEARFEPTKPLTFSSDTWTLACTIWELISQRSLFDGFLTNADRMTCEHVDALGLMPTGWWQKWETRGYKFTELGEAINRSPARRRTMEENFQVNVQESRMEVGMQPF